MDSLKAAVEEKIKNTHVLVYCKSSCTSCTKVKKLFQLQCVSFTPVDLDTVDNGAKIEDVLETFAGGQRSGTYVFINGKYIGGCDSITTMYSNGDLAHTLLTGQKQRDDFDPGHTYQYDVAVIGGGSGGLACSKELSVQGARVACLDFVKPTPPGATWGLGGTCVNVGCIPKKLMHQAALLGHGLTDSSYFGWGGASAEGGDTPHDWEKMVNNIQDHIGSLNWGYRQALRDKGVKYINGLGTFEDPHTLKFVNRRGKEDKLTAARFVIAVGGRPRYPDIPGAKEYAITSDDLFSLPQHPGKTLVVGGSYVALECSGFLAGINHDVTCMIRSIFLRGFDQQMADKIGDHMKANKVKFLRTSVPTQIELVKDDGQRVLKVTYKNTETNEIKSEEYNTVLFATGRYPDTAMLGLDKAGVTTDKNGKIPTVYEQTNVPHIYAIGDCVSGKLELTPVAIQAGKLLAKRLTTSSMAFTDYINTPTTVFTPLEFGTIGLAEEDAELIYGPENLEVYHTYFTPLEYTVAKRGDNTCYAKLICNMKDKERVIGFHYLGPNAGEVTQGYGVAIRLGATKEDFDSTIGIHPTCSETMTGIYTTKRSGVDVATSGC